ncbi:Protein BONZAI 3 [Hibiscus syriacus]|uniref:Protein BONZAI 3 n=1 Tax=Hibiscus syriacus TaxID=106335 RepID=A0A6A2YG26_HIBSY|nr:Protein BONZAI 3 [Hibiscus syriacus]
MGGCVSGDLKGGKQAVGGVDCRSIVNNNAGHNDAIDHYFRIRGQCPLFTQVELSMSASNLRDLDITSKSDTMAVVYVKKMDGMLEELGRTEVILNNLNPVWIRKINVAYQFEIVQNLVFHVYDVDTNYHNIPVKELKLNEQDFLGETTCFLSEILKGQLFVDQFIEKEQFSFLDYISSGFELNFMVAIDFTASNGNPRHQDSLHYIDPSGRLNSYQRAIMEVGEVIQFYDSDRRFSAWGFGGRTHNGTLSHCFNLNGTNASEVEGVHGIMGAYASALQNVTLSGPTLFGDVINKAAQMASQAASNDITKYFVLLIITDGVLTDIQQTMDALVRASDLPLSILIVGVGNADFKQMEILDVDAGHRLESSTGRVATRDIVQFVPMLEVHRNVVLLRGPRFEQLCLQGGQISCVQALLEELPVSWEICMRFSLFWDLSTVFPSNVSSLSSCFRPASWFKAKFPSSMVSMDDLVFDPSSADKSSSVRCNNLSPISWSPAPSGFLKFNVDGDMLSDRYAGGIGDILRNSDDKRLISFSESVLPF